MSLIWYVSFKYLFILKINYSWKIKISSYGIVLTFMLHAQILLKQQFQPRQSHWCQAQIGLIFSPLICIYVELWNMLVKGWVQKNDFSTWRIVSYAWSLSTSYYLLILKWKKLKRYCFLVEKVLLFIKKYCRKKVLSKGIRPLDTVKQALDKFNKTEVFGMPRFNIQEISLVTNSGVLNSWEQQ